MVTVHKLEESFIRGIDDVVVNRKEIVKTLLRSELKKTIHPYLTPLPCLLRSFGDFLNHIVYQGWEWYVPPFSSSRKKMKFTDWMGMLMQGREHRQAGLNAVLEIFYHPHGACSRNNLSKNCQANSSSHARIVADETVAEVRGKYHAKAV